MSRSQARRVRVAAHGDDDPGHQGDRQCQGRERERRGQGGGDRLGDGGSGLDRGAQVEADEVAEGEEVLDDERLVEVEFGSQSGHLGGVEALQLSPCAEHGDDRVAGQPVEQEEAERERDPQHEQALCQAGGEVARTHHCSPPSQVS
jgi:hypothetical protein